MSQIFENLQDSDCAHWIYGYFIELQSITIVIIKKFPKVLGIYSTLIVDLGRMVIIELQSIKIVNIKKCPKLLRIYSTLILGKLWLLHTSTPG